MFLTIFSHGLIVWRLIKTVRSYYFKFRPIFAELVKETEATDIDDKALAVLDKIFFHKAKNKVVSSKSSPTAKRKKA